ncbi:dioxygenase family protein [Altibacter lentus]|uniref:dioxygenase family protein n=1 Tax=Altibacter lentus TaxID=1223410 RepID=UPI00055218C9|nr:intradiol ring-cleavage dioxygenase [Altibacter lentus]MCT8339043.1 intradiol ring-cleavage dioxygenase [Thermobacterium salinum]
MIRILKIFFMLLACINLTSCNSQNTKKETETLSDDFDKSMPFYYKMPKNLSATDTSPAFKEKGKKILLTGTVYQIDGKTPASNVILYYYQTNTKGIYATKESEERNMPKNKLGHTHGYIRGWLKTDEQGNYSIYTIQPETYPSRDQPAHVHITVKEKNMNEPYYIDDFVFDNDRLLTTQWRKSMENRGGSGVIRFVQKDSLWVGERNIYLGLNIPDYPLKKTNQKSSGKNIGEDIISFTPFHAYGPDKGTKTCPICKYGWYHGILYFVGNNPNWNEIKDWLTFLETESQKREEYLKVYFVYGNENNYNKNNRIRELEKIGTELDLKKVALTFVPSFMDKTSEVHLNKIDPNVDNTFFIYKRSNIIDKYVDLRPNQENFERFSEILDKSANEYFKLSKGRNE